LDVLPSIPDEVRENVVMVRECFQDLLDAITEGKA
jgi:hypothetical protein